METLSEPIPTNISNNQKLSLIIRSRALTLQGPWHLEDQPEAPGQKTDLSGLPISFDYLITLQDSNNLIYPEDLPYVKHLVEELKEGKSLDYHFRVVTPAGEIKPLHGFGSLMPPEKGSMETSLSGQEEWAHVRQVGRLYETKELLQKTLDAIPQMVWMTDAQGRVQFYNDRWFAYTGLSPEQIENYALKDIDIFHPSQVREVMPHIEACVRLGLSYHGEILVRNHQHQYRWQICDIKPVHNETGEVERWVGTFTDVHDLFTSEKKLKESKELTEAAFNSTIFGIQVFDSVYDESHEISDLRWKYLNRKAEEIFGERNLTGKYLLEEFPGVKTSGLFEKFTKVIKTGEPADFEHLYNSEGFSNWFHVYVTNVEDTLVIIFQDITQRKLEESELQESKHFIHEVADSTPDLLYITDLEKKAITYINKRVTEIMGIDQKDVEEKGEAIFSQAHHPRDHERKMQHLAELERAGDDEVREIEVRLKVVDGSWRWFRIRTKVFKRRPDGTVLHTISLAQDIHDAKKAQEKMNLQHRIDRQAERIANIGNWEWNLQTGQVTWAENLYRMIGVDPGTEPSLERFIRAIHPDDQHFMWEESERIKQMDEGPLKEYQFRVISRDGDIRHIRSASELINRAGEKFLIGTLRDVTEDVQLHQELRERVRFIETLIDSSVDRIMAFDKELKFLVWNKMCEQTSKLSKEKVLGRHVLELFPQIKENKRILEAMHRALDGESVVLGADTGLSDTGYYDIYYVPLKNEWGQVYAVLNIIHDISEKVKSQQDLEALNRALHQKNHELKSMNEELSTFAFIASHDLREPLRKIELFSDALMQREQGSLSENGKEFLHKMIASIHRMNTLIDEILTFSRASAGTPKMLEFNLNQILEVVKGDLSDLLAERKVTLECQELPVIYGNPLQFSQLLQHLITNAIKFQRPDNIPHIRISSAFVMAEDIQDPFVVPHQRYLKIEVKDNGIGFEEKYTAKIFQMFQRLHGRSEFPGTGMGLAICKKVVDNHHGFIVVKSKPGEGAVFTCYFPMLK